MKKRLSEVLPGSCFKQGRKEKKKLSDGRVVSVSAKGKVHVSTPKGDPLVSETPCKLNLIGTGYRKHPEQIVEMGGAPRRIRDQRLR